MRRWARLAILGGGVATLLPAIGCGWVRNRSAFERDPFVMSHLTHSKADPLYASSENSDVFDDEPALQAASVSRKASRSSVRQAVAAPTIEPLYGHAPDYRWLRGRLERREGPRPGWYVQYATADEPRFDGRLLLAANRRLDLLREGDHVRLSGRLIGVAAGDPRYHIESLTVVR